MSRKNKEEEIKVNYIKQFGIILLISFIGEMLKAIIPLPIPASIYGLILMLLALKLKFIQLQQVKGAADFLIEIMPLMFIPAAVGLLVSWEALSSIWLQVVAITMITTIFVMAVTGRVTQWIIRKDKGGASCKKS